MQDVKLKQYTLALFMRVEYIAYCTLLAHASIYSFLSLALEFGLILSAVDRLTIKSIEVCVSGVVSPAWQCGTCLLMQKLDIPHSSRRCGPIWAEKSIMIMTYKELLGPNSNNRIFIIKLLGLDTRAAHFWKPFVVI